MATRPKTKKQKKEANKPTTPAIIRGKEFVTPVTPAALRIAKSQKF